VSAYGRIRTAPRHSLNPKPRYPQGIGQLFNVVRPIQDAATGLEIREAHAGAIDPDKVHSEPRRDPCEHPGIESRTGPPVKVKDGMALWVSVFGVTK
jgi:hypothetical protein